MASGTILTASSGEIRLDNLELAKERAEAEAAARKVYYAEQLEAVRERNTGMTCPLKGGAYDSGCYRDCSMFEGGGCILGGAEPRETNGKYCPIIKKACGDSCAMFSSGCTLRPVRG